MRSINDVVRDSKDDMVMNEFDWTIVDPTVVNCSMHDKPVGYFKWMGEELDVHEWCWLQYWRTPLTITQLQELIKKANELLQIPHHTLPKRKKVIW